MIRSNIDGPRESHTKSRQTEKDQYHMVTPRCGSQKTDTINSSERQEKLDPHFPENGVKTNLILLQN